MSNKDSILSGVTNFVAVIASVYVLQKFYPMHEAILIAVFMMIFLNILYISSLVIHSLHQAQEEKKAANAQGIPQNTINSPPQDIQGQNQIQRNIPQQQASQQNQ